jgi:hypothetical protein
MIYFATIVKSPFNYSFISMRVPEVTRTPEQIEIVHVLRTQGGSIWARAIARRSYHNIVGDTMS